MATDFEAELERGKEKIEAIQQKAESDRLKSDEQAESERLELFNFFGLEEVTSL